MSINKKMKLAIGLMSGTSLDGIDAALIRSDGATVERYGNPAHLVYSKDQRSLLKNALQEARNAGAPTKSNAIINQAEALITNLHSDIVTKVMMENNLEKQDVDVIGFHGQTVLHGPDQGWTWQIGDGAALAEKTGITVINDLRRNDMDNGGQGAPLAPIYHHAIISSQENEFPVALLNIGGVANLTWFGSQMAEDMVAFDTGPGNAFIDDWIRAKTDLSYDQDGKISAKGTVQELLVNDLMKNEYFKQMPPKSLDRDDFDVSNLSGLSLEDGAATLLSFSVEAIKMAEIMCPDYVKKWYVCGGGAHNPTLMQMLKNTLAGEVLTVSDIGFDGDYIEAEAFAFMAVRKIYDLPITFPGTTGVSGPSTGGIIHKA